MLPILPATIDTIFKTADMMLIIIVTIHPHPLPFNRPHATTKFAIPRTINITPSIPINPPRYKQWVIWNGNYSTVNIK